MPYEWAWNADYKDVGLVCYVSLLSEILAGQTPRLVWLAAAAAVQWWLSRFEVTGSSVRFRQRCAFSILRFIVNGTLHPHVQHIFEQTLGNHCHLGFSNCLEAGGHKFLCPCKASQKGMPNSSSAPPDNSLSRNMSEIFPAGYSYSRAFDFRPAEPFQGENVM